MATTLPRRDRYLVCSPYGDDLARARASGFRTWRTARDRRELAAALAGLRAEPYVSEAVSVRHTLLDERTIAAIRDVGAAAVAWTVNDLRRARHLMALGADGVTSDRVAVLRGLSALDPEGGGR
jgi:glycerophosphoryl diester phosphodiesterase